MLLRLQTCKHACQQADRLGGWSRSENMLRNFCSLAMVDTEWRVGDSNNTAERAEGGEVRTRQCYREMKHFSPVRCLTSLSGFDITPGRKRNAQAKDGRGTNDRPVLPMAWNL